VSGPLHGPGQPAGPRVALTPEQRTALGGPVFTLPTAQDTRAFGMRLAGVLRASDLLVLIGPLGAGKTVLVQGIGAGLDVRGTVVSPTFVIARVHRPSRTNRVPLVHVDAYRLASLDEVDDLDLDVDAIRGWGGFSDTDLMRLAAERDLGFTVPPNADTYWVGDAGPGPSFIEAGGKDHPYTNKTASWMAHNVVHMARILKEHPIPPEGNTVPHPHGG